MIPIFRQALETLLLALHFLCVDIAMIGPLGAIWLARRATRHNDPHADDAARWLLQLSWQALLAAIALGTGIGLLLWAAGEERFFTGLLRLPLSRLYFSAAELAFYFALVVPCAMGWQRLRNWPLTRTVVLLAAATNLIYHFPALFVSAAELAAAPATPPNGTLTSGEFLRLTLTPPVLAQVVHHVFSAVAVTGVAVMVFAGRLPRQGDEAAQPLAVGGARWALVATLLQLPVGLWLLSTLAPASRGAVLGADMTTTGLFIASMTAALGLLHYLGSAAMGDAGRAQIRSCAALLLLVVVLMTGTLRQMRGKAWTAPPATVKVVPAGVK